MCLTKPNCFIVNCVKSPTNTQKSSILNQLTTLGHAQQIGKILAYNYGFFATFLALREIAP